MAGLRGREDARTHARTHARTYVPEDGVEGTRGETSGRGGGEKTREEEERGEGRGQTHPEGQKSRGEGEEREEERGGTETYPDKLKLRRQVGMAAASPCTPVRSPLPH